MHFSLSRHGFLTGLMVLAAVWAVPAVAAEQGRVSADTSHAWLLHLPGIAGQTGIDRRMMQGLRDGGYDGAAEHYDWTGANPGIPALLARKHNDTEAAKIAERIIARFRADPAGQIVLTAHSGGTGLAVWALERLPDDVQVQTVVLLSSALSPTYDLSKALAHVHGKMYAFTSNGDAVILGAGTTLLGTIDGVKGEAAGKVGFIWPAQADAKQYEKLTLVSYDRQWMRYGHFGDHIGCMMRPFAAAVLTPILMADLPPPPVGSATGPATRPAAAS